MLDSLRPTTSAHPFFKKKKKKEKENFQELSKEG